MKRILMAAAVMAMISVASGPVLAASPTAAPSPPDGEEDWAMTASEFDTLMETGEWAIVTWTDEDGICTVLVIATVRGGGTTRSVTITPDG